LQRLNLIHGGTLSFSSTETGSTNVNISLPRLDAVIGRGEEASAAQAIGPLNAPHRTDIDARCNAPADSPGM